MLTPVCKFEIFCSRSLMKIENSIGDVLSPCNRPVVDLKNFLSLSHLTINSILEYMFLKYWPPSYLHQNWLILQIQPNGLDSQILHLKTFFCAKNQLPTLKTWFFINFYRFWSKIANFGCPPLTLDPNVLPLLWSGPVPKNFHMVRKG